MAGLELAGVRLGQDVDPCQPFHGGDGVPVGHDEPERGAVVGGERFAVHLVGDQDLRRRIGCVRKGERAHEGQVVRLVSGKDRLEVVRAVVGAFEANLDAVCRRLRLLEDVVQEGARPAGGGDGVVAPRLADRQGPRLEAPVPGALERDGPLDRRQSRAGRRA